MIRRRKQLPSSSLNLDRVLIDFGSKNHPDDCFTVRDAFEHIFITGSTGSGKTSTLGYYLAKSLLDAKRLKQQHKMGMIVFLYKSADMQDWLRWCKEAGRQDDIITINAEDKDVFNLLDHYRDQEAVNAVNALMNLSGLSLNGGSNKESESYWEQANRQRLHRLILLNQASGEPLNITTLYKLHSSAPQMPEQLTNEEFKKQSYCWQAIAKAAHRLGKNDPQFKLIEDYFVYNMPYMADRTQSSILSMTGAILEPFISSPLLNNLFCGSTNISIDTLLSGKIVLLNIPIQKYEYSGKLAQIMFKYVLQKQIEARDFTRLPNPVIFWMDEYQHYLTPYDFLFLSTARSSRAGCVLMTQNISNLYAQIGGSGRIAEEKVNALLSLTNHKFFMAQNSFITNEFASKIIGTATRKLSSVNIQVEQMQGSAGQSEQYHYQILPRYFTTLKRGGKQHQGMVEAYLTGTGKRFSTGTNYLKIQLQQPWYR